MSFFWCVWSFLLALPRTRPWLGVFLLDSVVVIVAVSFVLLSRLSLGVKANSMCKREKLIAGTKDANQHLPR